MSLSVVIPAAGRGSRFVDAGYDIPKPFIDVGGLTMIQRVIDNLYVPGCRYKLVLRREHLSIPIVGQVLCKLEDEHKQNVDVVYLDSLSEGPAQSVAIAINDLDDDEELLVANSDQLVDFDCNNLISYAKKCGADGAILTFTETLHDPKWSYAKIDSNYRVQEVAEKDPISSSATVGIYYFATVRLFNKAYEAMVDKQIKVNGEYYVCPLYNELISLGANIVAYEISSSKMHGLGIPSDLKKFLARAEF